MKKRMFFGLSAVAMLMTAPTASAGYWTIHSEIVKSAIENWLLNHGEKQQPIKQTPSDPRQGPGHSQTIRR